MNISVNNNESIFENRKAPSPFTLGIYYTSTILKIDGELCNIKKTCTKIEKKQITCLYIIPSHMNFSGSTSSRSVSLNSLGK